MLWICFTSTSKPQSKGRSGFPGSPFLFVSSRVSIEPVAPFRVESCTLMSERDPTTVAPDSWLRRHPVVCYFALTFFISWLGAFLVAAPRLLRGQPLPKLTGILMFPAMLVGPSLSGILLTRLFDGPCRSARSLPSTVASAFQRAGIALPNSSCVRPRNSSPP